MSFEQLYHTACMDDFGHPLETHFGLGFQAKAARRVRFILICRKEEH